MIQLETERLILRVPELSDAEVIRALCGDRRVAETTLNIPYPYPDGAALAWADRARTLMMQGKRYSFMMVDKTTVQIVGSISLWLTDGWQGGMGYWVGVPFWGKGYATEAGRSILRFGFESLHLGRIYASYMTHNHASARVMEKLGMQHEGVMRQDIFKWGRFIDHGYCSILRAEYEQGAAGG